MEGHVVLPGYTVGRRLGSDDSAMWLATEDATGRTVTLRLIETATPALRERIHAGSSLMKAIDHPHIVPLYDAIDVSSGVMIVCGAADGGSLADAVAVSGTLPPGEVVTACAPIAEALAEIHPHGIMHGSITLDDVVFSLEGRPMLAGVGMMQLGAPPRVGRQGTIAPEVAAGSPPSPSSDVFSLAAVAIVGLTGYLPRLPLSLPDIPPAAGAALARALERAPERRLDAATLSNALYAIADPEPVEIVVGTDEVTATGSLPAISGPPPAPAAPIESTPLEPPPLEPLPLEPPPAEPDDEVAGFMRGSGRRARRGADQGGGRGGPSALRPESAPPPTPEPAAPEPETGRPDRSARQGGRRSSKASQAASAPPRRRASEPSTRRPEPSTSRRGAPERRQPEPAESKGGSSKGLRKIDVARIAMVLAILLLVAGAVVVVQQFMGGDDTLPDAGTGSPSGDTEAPADLCGGPQPAPTATPPAVTDWTQEVQRLYTLREKAFEELDAELLCQVHAPTNPVLKRDVDTLQAWADAGIHAEGLTIEVVTAELVAQNGGRVTLEITDRQPAYQLVNEDGEVVEEKEGIPDTTWRAELVAVADEGNPTPTWRFG